jgi:hypothetical protein
MEGIVSYFLRILWEVHCLKHHTYTHQQIQATEDLPAVTLQCPLFEESRRKSWIPGDVQDRHAGGTSPVVRMHRCYRVPSSDVRNDNISFDRMLQIPFSVRMPIEDAYKTTMDCSGCQTSKPTDQEALQRYVSMSRTGHQLRTDIY